LPQLYALRAQVGFGCIRHSLTAPNLHCANLPGVGVGPLSCQKIERHSRCRSTKHFIFDSPTYKYCTSNAACACCLPPAPPPPGPPQRLNRMSNAVTYRGDWYPVAWRQTGECRLRLLPLPPTFNADSPKPNTVTHQRPLLNYSHSRSESHPAKRELSVNSEALR
jgi:hypothetical protein